MSRSNSRGVWVDLEESEVQALIALTYQPADPNNVQIRPGEFGQLAQKAIREYLRQNSAAIEAGKARMRRKSRPKLVRAS